MKKVITEIGTMVSLVLLLYNIILYYISILLLLLCL